MWMWIRIRHGPNLRIRVGPAKLSGGKTLCHLLLRQGLVFLAPKAEDRAAKGKWKDSKNTARRDVSLKVIKEVVKGR